MEEISEDLFISLSEEKIKEIIICPILPHFLKNPKMCENCEVHICEDCFTKSLEMNSCCPLCRCEIKKLRKPSKIILNLLETLVVKCQHWEEGCDFKSSPVSSSFLQHPSICLYSIASCPNYQCTIVTPRHLLSNHMSFCSIESVTCQFCEEIQTRGDMHTHLGFCKAKKTCKFCQNAFSSKKNENHEEKCPVARFICVYCRLLFGREEIAAHTPVCQAKMVRFNTPSKNNVFNVGMVSPQHGVTYGTGNTYPGGVAYPAERNLIQSNPGQNGLEQNNLHQLSLVRGQSLPQDIRSLQELMDIQNQEIVRGLSQNHDCYQNLSNMGSPSSNNNLNLAQNFVRNMNVNASNGNSTDGSGNLSQNLSWPQNNIAQQNGNNFEQVQAQLQKVICLKCNQVVIFRDFEIHKRECRKEIDEVNISQNLSQIRSPNRNSNFLFDQNNGNVNFNMANQNYVQNRNLSNNNNMNFGLGNAGQPQTQMVMVNKRNLVIYRN